MAGKRGARVPGSGPPAPFMSLGEHLEELRARLIKCLLALAAAFIGAFLFRYQLVMLLKRPHEQAMAAFDLKGVLNYAGYFEPLGAQLKVCVIAGVVVTAPVLIYQAWAFVAPGLFPHERSKVVKLGAASLLCFLASIVFGYFVFIPIALRFLIGLAGPGVEPVLMIGQYVTAFFLMTFALGIAFQTPIVVFCLVRWGVIDVGALQRSRKGVILGAFIVGAVITPPDPLTQIMMAVTLIILYDLGGLLAAPSRTTLLSFVRFTGSVGLLVAAVAAWLAFWPVAEVTARAGTVQAGGRALGPGQQTSLRRGAACRTGADSLVEVRFGKAKGPVFHLAGDGRLRVHGKGSVSLLAGEALAESPSGSAPLQVRAGPASLTLAAGSAALWVPDLETATVTVIEGVVEAKAGGREARISAGKEATFHAGGEPADLGAVQQRWQQRLAGTEPRDRQD